MTEEKQYQKTTGITGKQFMEIVDRCSKDESGNYPYGIKFKVTEMTPNTHVVMKILSGVTIRKYNYGKNKDGTPAAKSNCSMLCGYHLKTDELDIEFPDESNKIPPIQVQIGESCADRFIDKYKDESEYLNKYAFFSFVPFEGKKVMFINVIENYNQPINPADIFKKASATAKTSPEAPQDDFKDKAVSQADQEKLLEKALEGTPKLVAQYMEDVDPDFDSEDNWICYWLKNKDKATFEGYREQSKIDYPDKDRVVAIVLSAEKHMKPVIDRLRKYYHDSINAGAENIAK
jgi:hypothetical protein